jgi:beta-1,4-mannosyl-glycoprotein beta-1,4-N-acetylglucosaminyltransferase
MRGILPVRSMVNPILKNNRTFDCFFFFNELDVLEIRLESLFQFVDYFVLVESRVSFTGEEREPLYEKHKERFSKFHKQIIHIVIDEVPRTREEAEGIIYDRFKNVYEKVVASRLLKSHSVPKTPGLSQWVIEYFIKELLIRISDSVEDNDLIFISDVDEIWNSRARFPMPRNKVLVFKQKAHVYFLNNVSNESWRNWTGTIAINGRMFHQGSPSEMRVRGRFPRQVVVNGGWHLTLQGGLEVVEEKLESWDENELAADRRAKVEFFINSLVDLRGRNISYRLDNKNLPEGVLRNPNRYQKLIKR